MKLETSNIQIVNHLFFCSSVQCRLICPFTTDGASHTEAPADRLIQDVLTDVQAHPNLFRSIRLSFVRFLNHLLAPDDFPPAC